MLDFFVSFFQNPSAWGIGLAFAFGAVWLAAFAPPVGRLGLRTPLLIVALLSVFVASAILTLAAISFIQIPLQIWCGQALNHFWSQETLLRWILLAGIPGILLSGLVQEAAKLLPPLVYMKWKRPQGAKLALIIGAISGAGFGIFEAQWALNMTFALGWSWGTVELLGLGFEGLFPFWERFFAVAFHIGATAIAAYGLFRGKWWQFYLLAAFLHAFLNYSAVLFGGGYLTLLQTEIYIAVVAVVTVGLALWLRWRPQREQAMLIASETQEEGPAQ
jgi:hypothetical protein